MTPLSISQHPGTDPESVGIIAPVSGSAPSAGVSGLVGGNYAIAVSGYNGATSKDPYLLRARVSTPPEEATCPARTFPFAVLAAGAIPPIGAGVNTIFLTNPGRLAATHGAAAAATLAGKLDNLVAYLGAHPALGVVPAIVPLDAYGADPSHAEMKAAYDGWDANPCSVAAANDVAKQVTGIIAAIRTDHPGLAYITVVGGDDIVPMGRVPDLTRVSNEAEYASTFPVANPLEAAEAASYTLTDDMYGDPSPTDIGNGGRLFVPTMAVGRLVETPDEIGRQLDAFGAGSGALDTSTGLVAGYDFLADGAGAVASRLATGGRSIDGTLVDQPGATSPWTRADLLGRLFPTGSATPLLDSINGHYDHTALLPSAGNASGSTELVTASDVASRSAAGQLAGRILFTMGCHAGLSVPDAYVTGSGPAFDTLRGDWAQTLSAAGVAVYVANTGFGIGDTTSVAYSERLMALYAKLLDGSPDRRARRSPSPSRRTTGAWARSACYDLKILQQTTFYGLPFWGIGTTPPTASIDPLALAGPAVPAAPSPPPCRVSSAPMCRPGSPRST